MRTLGRLFALGALVSLPGAAAAGQSVLAAGGLGMPIDPVDARGRSLGSVGVGLFGTGLMPGDPVGAVDLAVPTITMTLQSVWLELREGTNASTVEGNRFPALGVSYPVSERGVVTLTYGGVLDQHWTQERPDTLHLEGNAVLPVVDRFTSDGGVSAARLGYAHRLSPRFAVGAAVGLFTGSSARLFTRTFDTLTVDVDIAAFANSGRWSYSGTILTVGALADIDDVVRAAGSFTWFGALEAEPRHGTEGVARSYDMPLEFRAGVSARLAPELSAALSLAWADWSRTGEDLATGSAGSTLAFGAGVEWEGATLFGKALPLRAGWRRSELPFEVFGASASESGPNLGVGLLLQERADGLPLASIDLGVERGRRSVGPVTDGPVTEHYWRSTLSFRVAGF